MEFLKNIQLGSSGCFWCRQGGLTNRPTRRRVNEAELFFPSKSASIQRRQFLGSACALGRAWLILIVLLSRLSATQLQAQVFKEYDIKAAFLYHLAQFVEWPPEAFPTAEDRFVIGILGADPFGKALDDIVADEVVKNRKLDVQRFTSVEEVKHCHILFISQSEAGRLDSIFARLKTRSILTVGDTEGFATRGGVVRFLTEKNKIRLRINLQAAKTANLTISSKLLRASELVGAK